MLRFIRNEVSHPTFELVQELPALEVLLEILSAVTSHLGSFFGRHPVHLQHRFGQSFSVLSWRGQARTRFFHHTSAFAIQGSQDGTPRSQVGLNLAGYR